VNFRIEKAEEEGKPWSVIYVGTRPQHQITFNSDWKPKSQDPPYEMDEQDPYLSTLHSDLKRDLRVRADNSTQASLPLFEKYQFLSPRKLISPLLYVQ
jgi:hypothetical protein